MLISRANWDQAITTHQNLQSTDYYIEVLQVPYIYFIMPNNGKSDRTDNESNVT